MALVDSLYKISLEKSFVTSFYQLNSWVMMTDQTSRNSENVARFANRPSCTWKNASVDIAHLSYRNVKRRFMRHPSLRWTLLR